MRKRTRRKVYYPPMSGLDVLKIVRAPVAKEQRELISRKMHSAIQTLTTGEMRPVHWEDLAHAVNASFLLAKDKQLGDEHFADIVAARDAIRQIGIRAKTNGHKFIAKGEELNAINLFAEIHDAQMEICQEGELMYITRREAELLRSGVTLKLKADA